MASAYSTAGLKGLDRPLLQKRVTFEVHFPRTPDFKLRLTHAELVQNPEAHDVLELEFRGHITSAQDKIVSDDPVVFTVTANGKTKEWVGYVHHLSPVTKVAQNALKIVCVSPSYHLKETAQKVYHNVTADQVVSRVAAAVGLAAVTQRHPRIHEVITNTGMSAWQLLRRLAKQSGFGLLVDGTTLRFQSKDQFFNDSLAKGHYFTYNPTDVPVNSQFATIFSFKPVISDSAPEAAGARVERVVNGMAAGVQPVNTRHRAPKRTNSAGRGVKGASQ